MNVAATPGAAAPTGGSPPTPPPTLEQAIENERTLLLQVYAMLKCLYEVLLYADDEDTIEHAEVAYVATRLIDESVARLDLVHLRPLVDAIRCGCRRGHRNRC